MPYLNNYQQSFSPYQQSFNQYAPAPQPQMPVQQPIHMFQQPTQSGITWVQGDIGARAYPIMAGSSALLMDSEGQNFYIKSADNSGMPTMKKYAYSEVVEEPLRLESKDPANFDTAKLASREEVKQLQEKIKELENQIASMEVEKRNNEHKGTPMTAQIGGENA